MSKTTFNKNKFLMKFASIVWEDFSEENSSKLSVKELDSIRELIKQLLSNPILAFRQDRWKKAWDLLVSEGIVKPLYNQEAEDKLEEILS